MNGDRVMTRLNAMDECSKNKRCVGIENVEGYFIPCLDSIYRSTAWDKYKKPSNQVFKKAESYGKRKFSKAVQNFLDNHILFTTIDHLSIFCSFPARVSES